MKNSIFRNYPAALLCAAFVLSQSACLADEETTSTVQSSEPGRMESKSYHAQAGQNGAKVSATKATVQSQPDGSVTSSRQHESHAVGAGGSAHNSSASSTTLGPDGSTNSEKHEATSTNP